MAVMKHKKINDLTISKINAQRTISFEAALVFPAMIGIILDFVFGMQPFMIPLFSVSARPDGNEIALCSL